MHVERQRQYLSKFEYKAFFVEQRLLLLSCQNVVPPSLFGVDDIHIRFSHIYKGLAELTITITITITLEVSVGRS